MLYVSHSLNIVLASYMFLDASSLFTQGKACYLNFKYKSQENNNISNKIDLNLNYIFPLKIVN